MLNAQFLLVVGLLTSINSVSAQQDPLSCDDSIVSIAGKSDIDFYSSCPVLDSMFFIDHTYSGLFELPGVKSIGQFSAGYFGPKLKGSNRVDDRVTSVSMPDLEVITTRGMLLAYLDNLTSISFPKLNTVNGDLVILDNYPVKKLTLPALSNVTGGVLIDGDFDEIHLPMLKSVAYMIVKSIGDLDCRALGANLSSLTFRPGRYDYSEGFTCSTRDENNRYNSSDPAQSSKSADSSPASSTGAGLANPTASKTSEAGNAFRVGFLGVLFGLIAMVNFGGLLM